MPLIDCGLDQIIKPQTCNDRGGIRGLGWYNVATVDWTAMLVDPLQFDPVNQLIRGYTMIGGATMNWVEFERKQVFYEFTFIFFVIFERVSRLNMLMPLVCEYANEVLFRSMPNTGYSTLN